MALDVKLRQIVSKQAGIYFIVTDKSQVADIEEESKLRLFFINTEDGAVNSLCKITQGDVAGFRQVYGKATRAQEKKGNFSHKVCEDALSSGPIGVINIRNFDNDRDVTNVATINPNTIIVSGVKVDKVPYVDLFDKNGFWSVKPQLVTEKYYPTNGYLNFANVGSSNVSIFVVKSTEQEVAMVTSEYNKTLESTQLEIDDYPGLNWNTRLKDAFVTVYVFKNDFKEATNNPYYGHLFNSDGNVKYVDINVLSSIKESGFYKKYVGSVIPNLKSEQEFNLSIDDIIYTDYMSSGLVCDINADLLEYELSVIGEANTNGYIDLFGFDSTDEFNLLSYINVNKSVTENPVLFATDRYKIINVEESTLTKYQADVVTGDNMSFLKQGTNNIKIGDLIECTDGYGVVESITLEGNEEIITLLDEAESLGAIAYGNGKYYAFSSYVATVGETPAIPWKIFYTTDEGSTWKLLDSGSEKYTFKHAYFGGGNLIAIVNDGTNDKILFLNESGKMVEGGTFDDTYTINDIVYGNGVYLISTSTKDIYFTNPASTPTASTVNHTSICFVNNYFYGVDVEGKLEQSNNGRNWTEYTTDVASILFVASFSNRVYIATDSKLHKMNLNGVFDEVDDITITTDHKFMRVGNGNTIFTGSSVTDATASDLLNNRVYAVKSSGEFLITVLGGTYTIGEDKVLESYEFDKSMYKYTISRSVKFGETDEHVSYITKFNNPLYVNDQLCKPFALESYKPVEEQFTNGTAKRQNEILDMINHPSIVRGIKGINGARYIIDCFKSFVENNYKYQYGKLVNQLDKNNKFVRAIINEPFIEDFDKSTNPLYKQTPNGVLDYSYIPEGGNKQFSTRLIDKFTEGADMCFFFGPGDRINGIVKPLSGIVSNLFYTKSLPFDIVANTTGYLTGVTELEVDFDDNDRLPLEKFRYNPIIKFGGITIFGNYTGQKEVSAQQQIHNSELLAYVKENLYVIAKKEAFTKGTYDSYLSLETEVQNFMNSLALAGAVKANPKATCNTENNSETSKYKIKYIHVEYDPVDCQDKVVFDLNIL